MDKKVWNVRILIQNPPSLSVDQIQIIGQSEWKFEWYNILEWGWTILDGHRIIINAISWLLFENTNISIQTRMFLMLKAISWRNHTYMHSDLNMDANLVNMLKVCRNLQTSIFKIIFEHIFKFIKKTTWIYYKTHPELKTWVSKSIFQNL